MDSVIKTNSEARNSALITPASQRDAQVTIFDALEILKKLAGMNSVL
jgi:hypothetical protein